jgi:hypothetical protein
MYKNMQMQSLPDASVFSLPMPICVENRTIQKPKIKIKYPPRKEREEEKKIKIDSKKKKKLI